MTARAASTAAALVVALGAGLAACGDDEAEPAGAVGEQRVGSVAALAVCGDWRGANAAQRKATIEDIRRTINLRDTATPTPELDDDQAAQVFDQACKERFSVGFRLYKLYAHASAFQRIAPE